MLLGHEEVANDICKMFLKGVIYCWIDAILIHHVDEINVCVCVNMVLKLRGVMRCFTYDFI